jgi:hypothetical protein
MYVHLQICKPIYNAEINQCIYSFTSLIIFIEVLYNVRSLTSRNPIGLHDLLRG